MKSSRRKFSEKNFVNSVWRAMKSQEKKNPALTLLHRQLGDKGGSNTLLVGLTGGIACGKTSVSTLLKQKKIPVIDADQIAHQITKPKQLAYLQILDVFGGGILNDDKTINRQTLGKIVFAHPEKREILEGITHPLVLAEIGKQVQGYEKKKKRLIVIDAALLFESDLHQMVDKTLLVTCNPEVQLKRLKERDHLSDLDAWQRILSQMPTAEKLKRADFVVDNSGTQAATKHQLMEILKKLTISSGFHTPSWLKKERKASQDLQREKTKSYKNKKDFLKALKKW